MDKTCMHMSLPKIYIVEKSTLKNHSFNGNVCEECRGVVYALLRFILHKSIN